MNHAQESAERLNFLRQSTHSYSYGLPHVGHTSWSGFGVVMAHCRVMGGVGIRLPVAGLLNAMRFAGEDSSMAARTDLTASV